MHEILLDNIIRNWAEHGQKQRSKANFIVGTEVGHLCIQEYNHHDYTMNEGNNY